MQDKNLIFLAIFLFSLSVRLLHLAFMTKSPFFPYAVVDDGLYHIRASGFMEGLYPKDKVFAQAPLYSLFLGVLYSLFGISIPLARVAGAFIGSLTPPLIFLISDAIFKKPTIALISGLLTALCGTLIYFDGEILPVSLPIFMNTLSILLLLKGLKVWPLLFFSGISAGLSAIARGPILIFVPFASLWLFLIGRSLLNSIKRGFLRVVLFLAGVSMPILPVAYHNLKSEEIPQMCFRTPTMDELSKRRRESFKETIERVITGRFTVISCNAGVNFRLGNDPDLEHVQRMDSPSYWDEFRRLMKEPYLLGLSSPYEQSRYHMKVTISACLKDPWKTLSRFLKKLYELFSGFEIQRNMSPYPQRRYSPVLRILLWKDTVSFPSGLLIPLGFIGLILAVLWKRENPIHLLILSFILAYMANLLIFFVTARYRAPILPMLTVYATFLFHASSTLFREKEFKRLLLIIVPTILFLILSNSSSERMPEDQPAYAHTNLGNILYGEGRFKEAEEHYRTALDMIQNSPLIIYDLGLALVAQGKVKDAIEELERAEEMTQSSASITGLLGYALYLDSRFEEAIDRLFRAVSLNPNDHTTRLWLGTALLSVGRCEDALKELFIASKMKPDDPSIIEILSTGIERCKDRNLP